MRVQLPPPAFPFALLLSLPISTCGATGNEDLDREAMTTATLVRLFRPRDRSALMPLIAGLHRLPEHRARGIWTYGTPQDVLAALLKQRGLRILIAERDGRIVGYLAGKFERRLRGQPRRVGHIVETFVANERRRQGVGLALVAKFLEWLRRKKAEDIKVGYVLGNRMAGSFWTGLGFRPYVVTANARPADVRARASLRRQPRARANRRPTAPS